MRISLLCILGLSLSALAAEPAPVKMTKTTSAVEFTIGDELFTRYVVGADVAKPYLWPLNAPGQIPVTRGWPMQKELPNETTDHVHQKSAWFCHGDVIPEGIELKVRSADKHVKGVDFWSETTGHGKIVCTEVSDVKFKGNVGAVGTKNEWRTSDGVKILDEVRAVAVVNFGDSRLITLDIDLYASVCPITFGDTKEGSMGVRVNDTFRLNGPKSDGVIVSADGSTAKAPAKDNLPMWGKRADWHDYSGTVDGKMVGIAIFDHPKNSQRSAWHTRAYGLMAANPFGRAGSGFPDVKGQTELVKLAKGDHLKLRYGILVHRGDAKESKVAEIFKQFAQD
jgi:Methane oxygenase PmoA